MRRWGLGLCGGVIAGWACGPGTFDCVQASDCEGAGQQGQCVSGYCAFPDETCDSGLRYGEHSGPLSGDCVSDDAVATEGSGPTAGEATDPTATTDPSATGSGPDTDPVLDDSSDGPGPGQVEFTDDELEGEFGAGTFDGTEWTGSRLAMAGGSEGTFVSRVFDAGATATWDTLKWWPDAPYGKRLPDQGGIDVGYPQGAVDMRDNVLLMHFDDGALLADGDEVLDASGAGSDGQVVSSGGPVALVPGIFGTALDDHLAARISIPTAQAPGLTFGEGDFTWSIWFRFAHACVENNVFMGVDNADGSDPNPHLWLGCTDDSWSECIGTVTAPRAAGVFRSIHNDGNDGVFFCSDSSVGSDAWHHAVVSKRGHANAVVWLMLDGDIEHLADSGSFGGPMAYPDDPDFTIGAFSRGTYPSEGILDEVAIWTRALTEEEALEVYRRGVTRLEFGVRVCSDPNCVDAPSFVEGFLDPPQISGSEIELPLDGLPAGRYVQYRVRMRGVLGLAVPALRAVTILGHT